MERPATLDEDIIAVNLPHGRTPILLKIGQSGFRWGFCFRVTDSDGNAIRALRFTTEP